MLLILDRQSDLHTMLYHSWTYLSLIHDIFTIKNNQFSYPSDNPKLPSTTYELDFSTDDILRDNAFRDFHEAAEHVDRAMNQWKLEYDAISSSKKGGEGSGGGNTDITSSLTTAMDVIPQMTERKKKIEMHVQIATRILAEIKRREIDKLQDFEDEIMTTGRVCSGNRAEVMRYMRKEVDTKEEYMDKMRLLIIYIICGSDTQEVKQIVEIMKTVHLDKWDESFVEGLLKKRPNYGDSNVQTSQSTTDNSFISGLARQVTSKSKSLLSNISGLLSDHKNLIHYNLVKKLVTQAQSR